MKQNRKREKKKKTKKRKDMRKKKYRLATSTVTRSRDSLVKCNKTVKQQGNNSVTTVLQQCVPFGNENGDPL
jgi:hypothetical protein